MTIIKESNYDVEDSNYLNADEFLEKFYEFNHCNDNDACGCEDCNCDVIDTTH